MMFEADSEGTPVKAKKKIDQPDVDLKIEKIWGSASYAHFNRDFRFNSQSTAMQFTPRKSIGGRAWLSISLASKAEEKALVLWCNTTLGLLMYWWFATKSQPGRGGIAKNALEDFLVLDTSALPTDKLKAAETIFEKFKATPLLPMHELQKDAARHDIDREFMVDVLGLPPSLHQAGGPMELLRLKLACEPSVLGHKKA